MVHATGEVVFVVDDHALVVVCGVSGTYHSPLCLFLIALITSFPLHITMNSSLLNSTLHPAVQSLFTKNRERFFSPRMV